MADRYVKNTGSNTSPYDTWAKAATTLATAVTGASAGDTIYVSSTHSATGLGVQTVALPGAANNPLKIIVANDSAEPPTVVATGGAEATTGTASYTIGPFGYVYGFSITTGVGATNAATINLFSGGGSQASVYENCSFTLNNSNSTSRIATLLATSSSSSSVALKNCTFTLGNNGGQGVSIGGRVRFSGGSIAGPSNYSNAFLGTGGGRSAIADFDNFDFSALSASSNLFSGGTASMDVRIANCKLPTSWTGDLLTGSRLPGQRVSMYNSDSADTNYRLRIEAYSGSIRDETVIVRTGGASDGTTPISWKMATNSDANELSTALTSDPIAIWNTTVGSAITATIEIITDNVTLTDAEAWVDVDYLGTSGLPLGLSISDNRATVLTTPANQTSSSETWTTTGLTTPVKQKLSVTFTPREVGFIYATVRLAKVSTTVYVDPKITVT